MENANNTVREIKGTVFRIGTQSGDGVFVEVPDGPDVMDQLVDFCARLTVEGNVLTKVALVCRGSDAHPKVRILSSKAFRNRVNELRASGMSKNKEE